MRSLTIRKKLILSFAIVIVVNLIFGFYSLHTSSEFSIRTIDAGEWTQGLAYVREIQTTVADIRMTEMKFMLVFNLDDRDAFLKMRNDTTAEMDANIAEYKSDVEEAYYDREALRDEDRQAIRFFEEKWNDYKKVSERIIELHLGGKVTEALKLLQGESVEKYAALMSAVDRLGDFNLNNSIYAGEITQGMNKRNQVVTIVFFALMLSFSAAIVTLLYRSLSRAIDELLGVSEALGEGDLRVSARIFSGDELGRLSEEYNRTIANISELVSGIQDISHSLNDSSAELNANASTSYENIQNVASNIVKVSNENNNQLSAIRDMTAAIEEVTGLIQQTSATIEKSAGIAQLAVKKSQEGSLAVEQAVKQMKLIETTVNDSSLLVESLGKKSMEIGHFVETITSISSQTNLLALNAAIEAARAGVHGQGFAVVADEVKKLANESQAAAEEITRIVQDIQGETKKAVDSMEAGTNEVRIGTEVVGVSGSAFRELADMSIESADQLRRIVDGARRVDENAMVIVNTVRMIERSGKNISDESQSVVAITEEQTATIHEISTASSDLAQISEELHEAAMRFTI